MNLKYIRTTPEKRPALLATFTKKMIEPTDEYYDLEREIKTYAREHNVPIEEITLKDCDYPEEIIW